MGTFRCTRFGNESFQIKWARFKGVKLGAEMGNLRRVLFNPPKLIKNGRKWISLCSCFPTPWHSKVKFYGKNTGHLINKTGSVDLFLVIFGPHTVPLWGVKTPPKWPKRGQKGPFWPLLGPCRVLRRLKNVFSTSSTPVLKLVCAY